MKKYKILKYIFALIPLIIGWGLIDNGYHFIGVLFIIWGNNISQIEQINGFYIEK